MTPSSGMADEPDEDKATRSSGGSRDFVHSLARGLALVQLFDADHTHLTLDEAAVGSGISRSAVWRLLRTLTVAGYVRFDGQHYSLTPRLLDLGYVQQSRLTLAEVARPHCDRLSRELRKPVSLAVMDGVDIVFLQRSGRRRIMSVALSVGSRLPAHSTAIGRAVLAWLPDEEIDDYLRTVPLLEKTSHSVTSAETLRNHLLEVRSNGWSIVEQELEEGLSAIAVPVRGRDGTVVAAINTTTQTLGSALHEVEAPDVIRALQQTAEQIGADLHPTHLT